MQDVDEIDIQTLALRVVHPAADTVVIELSTAVRQLERK
jgi:hypothetical protein